MLEPYLKYFWIYLEKMFFVFFEMSAFDIKLMPVFDHLMGLARKGLK